MVYYGDVPCIFSAVENFLATRSKLMRHGPDPPPCTEDRRDCCKQVESAIPKFPRICAATWTNSPFILARLRRWLVELHTWCGSMALFLAAFVLRGAGGYWCVCVCNTGFLPPFPSYWAISVLVFYQLKTILLEVENDPLERLNPSSKAPFSSPCVPLNMNISFRFHTWFGFASNSLTAHTRL